MQLRSRCKIKNSPLIFLNAFGPDAVSWPRGDSTLTDPQPEPPRNAGRNGRHAEPVHLTVHGQQLRGRGPAVPELRVDRGRRPHAHLARRRRGGAPAIQSDHDIVTSGDGQPQAQQWPAMEAALHSAHDYARSSYIRGTIADAHYSFHDPFVFLLHSNVDRLWAMWQRSPGQWWRLDPNQTYGTDGSAPSINTAMEPWAGGAGLRPWTPPENEQVSKTSKDISVVIPPLRHPADDGRGGDGAPFVDGPRQSVNASTVPAIRRREPKNGTPGPVNASVNPRARARRARAARASDALWPGVSPFGGTALPSTRAGCFRLPSSWHPRRENAYKSELFLRRQRPRRLLRQDR